MLHNPPTRLEAIALSYQLFHPVLRDKARRPNAAPEPSGTPPRNSLDLEADPAAAWLISQGTPTSEASWQVYLGEGDGSQQQLGRESLVASHPPHRQRLVLSEGSLVCFYKDGLLLVAKQAGSQWSLQPVPWGYHQGIDQTKFTNCNWEPIFKNGDARISAGSWQGASLSKQGRVNGL